MTTPETPTPPARDALRALDAEIATLLGWREVSADSWDDLAGLSPDAGHIMREEVPFYSSDWSAAGALVERMVELGFVVTVRGRSDFTLYTRYFASADALRGTGESEGIASRGPAALALACRDALRARAQGGEHGA